MESSESIKQGSSSTGSGFRKSILGWPQAVFRLVRSGAESKARVPQTVSLGGLIAFGGLWLHASQVELQGVELEVRRAETTEKYITSFEDELQSKWFTVEEELRALMELYMGNPRLTPGDYDEGFFDRLGLTVNKDQLVSLDTPQDERKKGMRDFLDQIAAHFRKVIRCVDNGRCSQKVVRGFYENDMCLFRRYAYGYITVLSNVHKRWRLNGDLRGRKWRKVYGNLLTYSSDLSCGPVKRMPSYPS